MNESICAKMKLKFILGAEEANLGSNDENVSLSFRWLLSISLPLWVCSSSTVLTVFHNYHSISLAQYLNTRQDQKFFFLSRSGVKNSLSTSFFCNIEIHWTQFREENLTQLQMLPSISSTHFTPIRLSNLFWFNHQNSYVCLLFSSKRAREIDDTSNERERVLNIIELKLVMRISVNQNYS